MEFRQEDPRLDANQRDWFRLLRKVVGTGWPEFRALDFDRIKHLLKRPVIVDTKNLLDSVRLRAMGFEYVGVGRH